jgi:hypothetical protein
MALFIGGLGVLSQLIFNRMRRRPAMYQPWWHVTLGAVGAAGGHWMGRVYDDTAAVVDEEARYKATTPSWVMSSLSAEERGECATA